jgi:branched-chain amino acid transport system permease protein
VLDAISEEKEAAAIGIDVLRKKLRVTAISAALTAFGGGIAVSLQLIFAAIAGGMYAMLGPRSAPFSRSR